MFEYLDKIEEMLNEIRECEEKNIRLASNMLIKASKNNNSIYCFGTSHASIITQELFYRAGGLVNINPIWANELLLSNPNILNTSRMERLEGYGKIIGKKIDFKKNDVLIMHSVSGRNPVVIDLSLYAKEKGVKIIAITNLSYSKNVKSRHSSEKNLYQLADIVLDNHGPIGDACVELAEDLKVGASSTITAAAIVNEIVVQTALGLAKNNNNIVPVFKSANQDGNDEINKKTLEHYKNTIHYSI